ncbi:hypothetical protein P3342_005307 [Pyrenophora teres f. teres]|nr:hypothetical protein P3342_005307 [Pyrenophora teres f. teres]
MASHPTVRTEVTFVSFRHDLPTIYIDLRYISDRSTLSLHANALAYQWLQLTPNLVYHRKCPTCRICTSALLSRLLQPQPILIIASLLHGSTTGIGAI